MNKLGIFMNFIIRKMEVGGDNLLSGVRYIKEDSLGDAGRDIHVYHDLIENPICDVPYPCLICQYNRNNRKHN